MKPKNTSVTKLKKKLWEVLSKWVKDKYCYNGWGTCYTSGVPLEHGTSNCQAGHCFSRSGYPAIQFDPDNIRLQSFHDNINLHGNPHVFRKKLVEELGLDRVEELERLGRQSHKWSRNELMDIIEMYS